MTEIALDTELGTLLVDADVEGGLAIHQTLLPTGAPHPVWHSLTIVSCGLNIAPDMMRMTYVQAIEARAALLALGIDWEQPPLLLREHQTVVHAVLKPLMQAWKGKAVVVA